MTRKHRRIPTITFQPTTEVVQLLAQLKELQRCTNRSRIINQAVLVFSQLPAGKRVLLQKTSRTLPDKLAT